MTAIVNLPTMYMTGGNISVATNTTLGITAGQFRDSTNSFDIVIANSLVVTGTAIGLNGLDTGALGNNKFYYVFIIGDSAKFRPSGAIISLSNTTPILPFGYDLIRLVGICLTDGSAHFLPIYQSGVANDRTYFYDTPINVLTDGAVTTFTPVNLGAAVPSISNVVLLNTAYTPQAVNNTFALRPTGSASSATILQNGIVAATEQDLQVQMPVLVASGNASLDYKVINAGDKLSLFVAAFNLSL
jgi:hypothetical protein